MPVQVIVFGQLTDILGHQPITMDDAPDVRTLMQQLTQRYPALANASFIIAVDKLIVSMNTTLTGNNTVALLPPFAGG